MVKHNVGETLKHDRIMRVNMLLKTMMDAWAQGRIVSKEKVISHFSLKWGTARRTLLEYLKVLELEGKIWNCDDVLAMGKAPC